MQGSHATGGPRLPCLSSPSTCWVCGADGDRSLMSGDGMGRQWQRASRAPSTCVLTLTGLLTGRCVNYSSVLRTCEIQGWCPTEVDTVEM